MSDTILSFKLKCHIQQYILTDPKTGIQTEKSSVGIELVQWDSLRCVMRRLIKLDITPLV